MANVPLGRADYHRSVAKEARIETRNRYFEQNPVLNDQGTALISRPGLRRWLSVGDGPIRGVHSTPGSFDDDLFVVSGDSLYRVTKYGVATYIMNDLNTSGRVSMVATGSLDGVPEYLFVTDGRSMYVYNEDGAGNILPVALPDDVGMISLAYVASYVVCVPAQGFDINGRFYWIEPGAVVIDPLNFATAESAPDPIYAAVAFGDQFWLPGQSTTEVWYFSGNPDAPVSRLQGVAFNRGTWEGTAVQVKESMVIVDNDGAVFQIAGGLDRISTPAVEERVRRAIAEQASRLGIAGEA